MRMGLRKTAPAAFKHLAVLGVLSSAPCLAGTLLRKSYENGSDGNQTNIPSVGDRLFPKYSVVAFRGERGSYNHMIAAPPPQRNSELLCFYSPYFEQH